MKKEINAQIHRKLIEILAKFPPHFAFIVIYAKQ